MTRKILYFPISVADQNRIDPASIIVDPGPADFPDAIRIRFTITDPAAGAPRIQPFFPGQLSFKPEAGTLPDETTTFAFTPAEYQTWQTRGTLLVDANTAAMRAMKTMTASPAPPELLPNRVAYWPIRLPETFLYGTLITTNQLKHAKIHRATGGSVAVGTADWKGQAVAGFLNTTYRPEWREHASDPAQDDVQQFPMPTVEMDPATGAVELWMAGAYRPAAAFLDDRRSIELDAAVVALGNPAQDDIHHPLNGTMGLWNLLQLFTNEMIDADLLNSLADKITIRFPESPRFFEFRFTLMGRQKANYHCGIFSGQRIVLRDSMGAVLQDRRIPLHGRITVSELPPAAALPVITVELDATGPLDPALDFVGMAAAGARTFSIDFSSTVEPRLTLTPSDPTLHGEILVALHSSPTTQTITSQTLAAWENDIRPGGWPPAGIKPPGPGETSAMIFSGSRKPWVQITAGELEQFLAGLRHLVSVGPPPGPTICPANAILLWIMEGKAAGTTADYGFITTPARPWINFKAAIPGFSDGDRTAASDSDIKTLIRVWALWNLWGLDDFNHHAIGNDNQPLLSGNLSTAVTNQDAAFEAGRARVIATGVNPPALNEINDAFEVSQSGSNWKFRITSDHHERLIWLQYSEMQRRMILLAPHLAPPSNDVWKYFGFGYMSYNGGMEDHSFNIDQTKTVFREWTDATSRIGVAPCAATNQQDALRCKKVTATEMAMVAPWPTKVRRGSSRINGMQVAALSESFALLYPSGI